jgi:hypothetical protein
LKVVFDTQGQSLSIFNTACSLAEEKSVKAALGFEQARDIDRLAGETVKVRRDAERGATGPAAMQAKADTTKAELDAMKAEIAYHVARAQLAGLICGQ